MGAVIFVGPTLPATAVSGYVDATILPPVQQGDVYRAVKGAPDAIGIIDGYFDGVPSVWHKEILWAIEQGIPVFGSASMGALRAAELADFGMIGVGRIFEDYLSGRLQDDDEVAVLHSPAELGFQPLSEPMVSIRATLEHALDQGVLQPDIAQGMVDFAKALNYRERVWGTIIDSQLEKAETDAFQTWLSDGKIDAKREDAVEMLALMAQHLGQHGHRRSPVRVERTLAWRELCERVDAEHPAGQVDANLIDELRLDPVRYGQLRDTAALSLLSREDALRSGYQPGREDLMRQMARHRTDARLTRHADLLHWLEDNDLTLAQYETWLADRNRTDTAIARRKDQLDAALLDELRRVGDYADLRDRAHEKARIAQDSAEPDDPTRNIRMLIWYFETRLDQPVPDDLDSYAAALGLDGRDAFIDLIKAEYLYCHTKDSSAAE